MKNNNIDQPVLFYLWHDAQVGHLCFSFIHGTKKQLPFDAPVNLTNNMNLIIIAFLKDSIQHGCILKNEIVPDSSHSLDDIFLDDESYTLMVYCKYL